MSDDTFTRRGFIRLSAGAAALGLVPNSRLASKPWGIDGNAFAASATKDTLTTSGTATEMAIAKAWAGTFQTPAVTPEKIAESILPEAMKHISLSFMGARHRSEYLPAWKFEIGYAEIKLWRNTNRNSPTPTRIQDWSCIAPPPSLKIFRRSSGSSISRTPGVATHPYWKIFSARSRLPLLSSVAIHDSLCPGCDLLHQ